MCLIRMRLKHFFVGEDNSQTIHDGVSLDIVSIISHEDFHPKTFINDIALIIAKPLFHDFITPICFPTSGSNLSFGIIIKDINQIMIPIAQ